MFTFLFLVFSCRQYRGYIFHYLGSRSPFVRAVYKLPYHLEKAFFFESFYFVVMRQLMGDLRHA